MKTLISLIVSLVLFTCVLSRRKFAPVLDDIDRDLEVVDVCSLPLQEGECDSSFFRFYYNQETRSCDRFVYKGCGGNANRFESLELCEEYCERNDDTCTLPSVEGPCMQLETKWFLNPETGECETFTYGGCGGNSNKFDTKEDCEARCKCCDPNTPKLCSTGQAGCCHDGTWVCPDDTTGSYTCGADVLTKKPHGTVCGRNEQGEFEYDKRHWFTSMERSFEGTHLKACVKREIPPVQGSACAVKPKTCYFGDQECPGFGSHPTVRCDCSGGVSGGTWACIYVDCPVSQSS
jgi:hypothetical protein